MFCCVFKVGSWSILSFSASEDKPSYQFLPLKVTVCNVCLFLQIAFAMFGVYVMIDERNVLDAQKVFVSMALINILKTPLSQLPFAMSTTMQVDHIIIQQSDK